MHLAQYPAYFVKGTRRKAAYYTVQARELLADGWLPEENTPQVLVQDTPGEEDLAAEVAEVAEDNDDLNAMTKTELIAYAELNGIEFRSYATKAEILEACLAASNA